MPSLMIRKDHGFAKALKRAMKAANKSNGDVARSLSVSRSTVSGWLTGSEPTNPNFGKLVILFPSLAEFS